VSLRDVVGGLRRAAATPRARRRSQAHKALRFASLLELARRGPAPLVSHRATDPQGPLSIATVIPSFRRGSGGHATVAHLLRGLVALGHSISLWLEDGEGRHADEPDAVTKQSFEDFFGTVGAELHTDLDAWQAADVVLATGWQTVARALMLPGASARAYLVQDHEPDFYGSSAEALWAEATYRQGLHCIAASPWLAELLRSRYGANATHFDLAVDHTTYHATAGPRQEDLVARQEDLVVFYARDATPRRAVPLGLLALSELSRRRPNVRIALYGEARPSRAAFEHRHLGLLDPPRLAELYRSATVGMVLSLTNPSLVGLEMMASGLPCVELASESMLASFGRDGPFELAAPEPLALCEAIESLLDDPARQEASRRTGLELMRRRTWEQAASQLEAGLFAASSVERTSR
jgi:glycosyltransferase involved in cell wall biosynthesis